MVSIIYSLMVSLAAALVARDQTPQPLSLTLNKIHARQAVVPNPRNRAAKPQNVKLYAGTESYQINLGIINKDQQLQVILDTGSGDFWVDKLKLKNTNGFTKIGEKFALGYVDGSYAIGDYGTSLIFLENGVEIKDLQWALATEVNNTGGTFNGNLGVGKTINEETYDKEKKTYPNFTQKLKDNGIIASNSYSYFLNKWGTKTGTITFGGRDLAKVSGKVATLPLSQTPANIPFDTVTVSKFTTNEGRSIIGVDIILDTGTTLAYLPTSIVKEFGISGITTTSDEVSYIPCTQPSEKFVSWWFNDVEIKIPYSDLAVPEYTEDDKPTGKCLYAFQGTLDSAPYIVGDSFLRSAYVTVNHDTNQVQISNVNYTDKENIVAI